MVHLTRASRSVLLHRIKAGLYALITLVLAGWLPLALNEDLMFRIVSRYFFPESVARYEHPFENAESFLLWFVPLLIGFAVMLLTTVMTVHHFKKRHLYSVLPAKKLAAVEHVLVYTDAAQLEAAFAAYARAGHVHLVVADAAQAKLYKEQAQSLAGEGQAFSVHVLRASEDLHVLAAELTRLVDRLADAADREQAHVVFDMRFTTPLVAAAALFAALESSLCLAVPQHGSVQAYELRCEMED